ncbi:MAG: VWA domain-containing protein [Acidimicrobiales bacterium]|nr:VWA domain-containing protein [Acidimicrobiales bacterium]
MPPELVADELDGAPVTPVARMATGFAHALRWAGIDVPVGATVVFYEALGRVGIDRRNAVYWAGRSTLIARPEDHIVYDRVFDAFWQELPIWLTASDDQIEHLTLAIDDDDLDGGDDGDGDETDGPMLTLRYSPVETLHDKDFAQYTDAELAEAHRLMARMQLLGGRRLSRRRRAHRRRTGRPDLRRTVRRAMRTAGEPVERRFTRQGERERRIVFLLDVSGSMESYARALLRFVQAAVVGRRRVEVFTLGTRLTRITRELSSRDPDAAIARTASAVDDWSGGTRLGESLRAFNDEWGVRGMARGATVVILSDGWDRGEPEAMDEQMARLERVAHRVVWVNPLKATPGYQPLAQGMAAALPHVDQFIEGHCLDSLEYLAQVLEES